MLFRSQDSRDPEREHELGEAVGRDRAVDGDAGEGNDGPGRQD